MKKLTLLLLILSCTSYTYDDPMITKAAINQKKAGYCATDNCDGTCPRGPRGHRGHRGRRGITGATGAIGATGPTVGCGLSEFYSNGFMMRTNTPLCNGDFLGNCIPAGYCPYNFTLNACLPCYFLLPSTNESTQPAGLNFTVPIDLDNTQPVTLVVHFLVYDSETPGGLVNFQVEADYKSSGDTIGILPPATGFAQTVLSGDFTITEPAPSDTIQISQPVSLDPSLMTPGEWAFLSFIRVAPASDEYDASILLTSISFQYSRLCS